LTANQYFTAGRIIARSNLITILPYHLIATTGMEETLVWTELPFSLPELYVDMLWHERDTRSPAHQWLREQIVRAVQLGRRSSLERTGTLRYA
jgi:DNA-binding transcriptional LysR family regulator